MRVTTMVAGMALVLAACGGEKKGDDQAAKAPDQAAPADAAATPAGTGATHDVNMILEGTVGKFEPEHLTIKAGDIVRFHNKQGGPHNVQFYPDSIPSGAQAVLDAAMPDKMGPLASPLMAEQDAVYQMSFAGAPAGAYKFYCLPHQAMGMKGEITIK